jgi:hypothetical protein
LGNGQGLMECASRGKLMLRAGTRRVCCREL